MILRIFATDGHTPERIFRWSVEETAAHLCEKQLLWVTKLDGPYKPLVDWFLKQPCCRGVCLDPADRWEWNREHEITYRLAQALYFQDDPPEAVCWLHDDMAPPECWGFKRFVKQWLADRSQTAMAAPCYQLWDSFDSIRVDGVGMSFAGDAHCWLAKWRPDLRWTRMQAEADAAKAEGDNGWRPDFFFPVGVTEPAVCPYPFRHAKGLVRDFREQKGFLRRGFPEDRWRNAEGVRCVPYRPDELWEEFKIRVYTPEGYVRE